jgi:hypothetical protein
VDKKEIMSPCPFCGNTDEFEMVINSNRSHIACEICGARGALYVLKEHDTLDHIHYQIKSNWNLRSPIIEDELKTVIMRSLKVISLLEEYDIDLDNENYKIWKEYINKLADRLIDQLSEYKGE